MEEISRILKPGGTLIFTSPFGKAKVERPFHRIYNQRQVERLLMNFRIEKTEYSREIGALEWGPASLSEVENVDGYHACVMVKAAKPS
jgi:ubiquinone/menaquinone biosynthesis C-methylase UbiE